MTSSTDCQTPSKLVGLYTGHSGSEPEDYHESCFVADEAPGVLDIEHTISVLSPSVTVCIATTRYVGQVDNGFLTFAKQHIEQGTLAEKLLLTIRARIAASETGGTFGVNGLDVEVWLHKGTDDEKKLGKLEGDYGSGSGYWQNFQLEVETKDVKFPDDPCWGQEGTAPLLPCAKEITPASNEITFQFTGSALGSGEVFLEVDWLTLKPKDALGLAWRPVLLIHGWIASSVTWAVGTAWIDGIRAADIAFCKIDLPPDGPIFMNGDFIKEAVEDMKSRFGVDRINIVAHSKGGIDSRACVAHYNDVDTLIMIATPNAGTPEWIAGFMRRTLIGQRYATGVRDLSPAAMNYFNPFLKHNYRTIYVTVAGHYDSFLAQRLLGWMGPNDEVVPVSSVESLWYAAGWTYLTSVNDVASVTVCRTLDLKNHSCLLYYSRIFDELFPLYIAVLTPPSMPTPLVVPPARAPSAPLRISQPDRRRRRDADTIQGVMSDAGVAASGSTSSHTASLDGVGTAAFLMYGNPNALRFELVSPTGARIDASTSLVDANVIYTSFNELGILSKIGYYIEAPAAGDWTLEVTDLGVSPPEGSTYNVTVFVPLILGSGVTLTAALDQEHYVVGGTVKVTATVEDNGIPVTNATVTAIVVYPDSVTSTEIVLYDDGTNGDATAGDGKYIGLFTGATEAGFYDIIISAARTSPAFTREQVLMVPVAQSSTAFSGTASDHGIDSDGDGLYNQLVIDVEVAVGATGLYRMFGTLTNGAGEIIEQVNVEQELQPGLQTVPLSFDGASLYALGHDGPYVFEDLMLVESATALGLGQAPSYTTAAYTHTQFQRPPCLLTGNASDHGAHTDSTTLMPYEALVVAVEVDMLFGADVQAQAKLYSEDGTFVAPCITSAALGPGLTMLEFSFAASRIFQSGKPGPYTLQLLSLWGTTVSDAPTAGSPIGLSASGVVAITQPYQLEDFGEPPRYTIGGTVTGLVGTGLVLYDHASGFEISPGNGVFTFDYPKVSGSAYDVSIKQQPMNPIQVCSIANGAGIVGGANVTDIVVDCVTPAQPGGLDPNFGSNGKVTANHGGATAIALQSDGKIVLVGGTTLARYHSDGSADESFGTGGRVTVVFAATSVTIQADGKIVVAGTSTGSRIQPSDFAVARYEVTGALDLTFGSGGTLTTDFGGDYDEGWTVLIQADGKIVVGGQARTGSPIQPSDFAVARYTANGALDMSFGTGGKVTTPIAAGADRFTATLLQPDGKIVVTGWVSDESTGADADFGVARYTANGALDPSFGVGGIVRTDFGLGNKSLGPNDLALQSDGKLVVVGFVTLAPWPANQATLALARFDATGALDLSFGTTGLVTTSFFSTQTSSVAHAVAIQADGKIVVAGSASAGSQSDFAVARYEVTGALDLTFGSGGTLTVDFFGATDIAQCIAIQADGKIVVAGSARNVNTTLLGLVRIMP